MASITAVNSNSKMTIFKAQVCLNKENVQIIIFFTNTTMESDFVICSIYSNLKLI